MKLIVSYWVDENKSPQVFEVNNFGKMLSILKIVSQLQSKLLTKKESILLSALPDNFTRKKASDICTGLGFSKQFFEISYRKDVFKKLFEKVDYGIYKKV